MAPKKPQLRVIEVGPRDGLQNQKPVDLATRKTYIEMLLKAGIGEIEAGSLVRPERVPQMNDSEELFRQIK
ncbi:MAG: hypothetical protein IH795_06285 [Bacteroidetes bacterium]|nr:hypothetical protein [Bacteroidota bacterium]